MRIAVLYGSVRKERQGIKAARFILNELQDLNHEVRLIDALEADLPLMDKMHKMYEAGSAPKNLQRISDSLHQSDAIVVVSGEYNHSIPPALKNMLDFFQKEYHFKACGIVTYSAGPFGGVRVGSHLRAVLGELGMITIPTMFPISAVAKSFDDDGKALEEAYPRRVKRFLEEFIWYAEALNAKRLKGTPHSSTK